MKNSASILKKISVFSLLTVLLISLSSFTRGASWEHLGSRTVNYTLDKDVIKVTAKEGRFTKLKLKVSNGALRMHKMVVQYGNGEKDIIPMKYHFSRRSASRVIDLKGGKRIIKDITFFYDSKNRSRQKAKVHVFGKH